MNFISKRFNDLKMIVKYRKNALSCETLFINLTSKCNSKCIFCEAHSLDVSRDMSSDDIFRVVEESKALGARIVYLSGGEPFLNKDIWEVIKTLRDQGQSCAILSNGLLIEKFDSAQLAALQQAGWLDISLEAADPKIHDELRGKKGFFEKTIHGIEILKRNSNTVNLNTIICGLNFDGLKDLIKLAKEMGIGMINFQPVHIWSNYHDIQPMPNKTSLTLTEAQMEDLDEFLDDLIKFSRSIAMHTSLPHVKPWLKTYFQHHKHQHGYLWMQDAVQDFACIEVFTKAFVDADGSVLPCALLKPCASVKEMPLKEALGKCDRIKLSILQGNFPEECHKCSCQMAMNYVFSLKNSPIKNRKEIFRIMTKH